jgi:DedD protein
MARSISDEELQLKRRARRRLIGAIVLVTAIVIVLPMVLDTEPKPIGSEVNIKIPSSDSGGFTSRVVPVAPPGETKIESATKSAPRMAAAPEDRKSAAASGAAPESKKSAAALAATPSPDEAASNAERSAKRPPPQAAAKAPDAVPKKSASTNPAAPPFVVQVVALADAEKAKQVQAQIAAAGVKAYTEVVKTAKGDVTRVRAGPFSTRAAAEKARDQLKAAGLNGNIVAK